MRVVFVLYVDLALALWDSEAIIVPHQII